MTRRPTPNRLCHLLKRPLTALGGCLSPTLLFCLQSALNYAMVGRWMNAHGFSVRGRVQGREHVWAVMASMVRDRRVLYLEFGVAEGESIRYWSTALHHPEAMLHGFDSFEGLPENGGPWHKGDFEVGGRVPKVDDPRVRFFKGWFNETLMDYSPPPHDVLVLNMDADLHSSTSTALSALRPHFGDGTLIYFDDFNHPEQEPRAFSEFMAETELRFVPLCADRSLTHVAFKCVG